MFFSGFAGEFGRQLATSRAEEAARAERAATQENAILQHLSTADDPEIASMAITGLLNQAGPQGRKAKGLRGFLGEQEGNPMLPTIRELMRAGKPQAPASAPAGERTPGEHIDDFGNVMPGGPAASPQGAGGGTATSLSTGTPAAPGGAGGFRQAFHTPLERARLEGDLAVSQAGAKKTAELTATGNWAGSVTPEIRTAVLGHQPPFRSPMAAGTGQGKIFPPGSVDNSGQPLNPDGYYSQRVNPQDPSDVSYFPVNAPASAAVDARYQQVHKVGPDGKTPAVYMVSRDGSRPERFVGYQSVRGSYLQFVDPDTQEISYIPAAPPLQQAPGMPGQGSAMAPPPAPAAAVTAATRAAATAPPAAPAQAPAAAPPPAPGTRPASSAPRGAISGGRKRNLSTEKGAFVDPTTGEWHVGEAWKDEGLGKYFSLQDPTQEAVGFVPGDVGTYAVTAHAQANTSLLMIQRAIKALQDGGYADNDDPTATAAFMAKFYGGQVGGDLINEAVASTTNLAALQSATQYVRSNSRSFQMFQEAKMHVPRAPSERMAQLSQIPMIGGAFNPMTAGIAGSHGWDSPKAMLVKLGLAESAIQRGKVALTELVGKTPDRAIGAGGAAGAPPPTAGGGRGRGATPAPSTTVPTVGERRTINGQLAEWDGRGWKAVQ